MNYYDILGVSKNADATEIRKAYQKLAHKYHPDKAGGDEKRFKEINEAYQVLKDKDKRVKYDQFGQGFENFSSGGANDFYSNFGGFGTGEGFEFDLGDIFSDFFGGRRTARNKSRSIGADLQTVLTLEFEEAVFGADKDLNLTKLAVCDNCHGLGGEPGSKSVTCSTCSGSGRVEINRQTIFGRFREEGICSVCAGEGKIPEAKCSVCQGAGRYRQSKSLRVKIPAGINNDQTITLSGQGEVGARGGRSGDLYIKIKIKPHKIFSRQGVDIFMEQPISFTQAALGDKIEVPTLSGLVKLNIPKGIQPETVITLDNKGVPYLNNSGRRGKQKVTIKIITPKRLSAKERQLFEELKRVGLESAEAKYNKNFWQGWF